MTRFLLAAAAALSAGGVSAQTIPPASIAVVDLRQIYSTCNACRAADAQLRGQQQAITQRTQQLNQALQAEDAAIRQARGSGPVTPAIQQRLDALQARRTGGQREINGMEESLRRNRAYARQQIDRALLPIVQQVMQQRGANMAVSRQALITAGTNVDVTVAVLGLLNQRLPSVSVAAPAATRQ